MISIVVPVWNRCDLTLQLMTHLVRTPAEIVVVDNGSTDSTPAVLAPWKSRMGARLIAVRNESNRGFGPANNQGAALAKGELLIFLSNDVLPLGDFITPFTSTFARKSNVLAGPQFLDYDTGWNTFGGRVIPYLAGWCLACTRATWEVLGGFDERYVPCDYEDIDLSYTAQQKGVELVAVDLPLRHQFGQSASRLAGGREAITLRNQARFVEKWGLA